MKKISQEELKNILDDHKLWLDVSKQGGKRADLSNTDLSHVDLSYKNLFNANLSNADLSNADLSNADLSSVDLSYANLSNADLAYADLSYANLSCTNLSDANLFNVTLFYADLFNANLHKADLSHANLCKVDLSYADLSDANLIEVINKNIEGEEIIAVQVTTLRKNNLISYWTKLDIWTTGCFQGTLEELKKDIEKTYKNNSFLRTRYERAINYILEEVKINKEKK